VPAMKVGERGRNRTFNLLIKRQLLCQLSYAPTVGNSQVGQTKIIALVLDGGASCEPAVAVAARCATPMSVLRAASFGRETRFPRCRTAWRQVFGRNRRPVLDRANHRSFVHSTRECGRGKTLLTAHLIDETLLPTAEYRVRKNLEIPEYPQQI
jgi:hypothetical protein